MALLRLNYDVLHLTVASLDFPSLLNFSLASKRLRDSAIPRLFKSVVFNAGDDDQEGLRALLDTLSKAPKLFPHVRTCSLRGELDESDDSMVNPIGTAMLETLKQMPRLETLELLMDLFGAETVRIESASHTVFSLPTVRRLVVEANWVTFVEFCPAVQDLKLDIEDFFTYHEEVLCFLQKTKIAARELQHVEIDKYWSHDSLRATLSNMPAVPRLTLLGSMNRFDQDVPHISAVAGLKSLTLPDFMDMDVKPENGDTLIWGLFRANPTLSEIIIRESPPIHATCDRTDEGSPANVVIVADGRPCSCLQYPHP